MDESESEYSDAEGCILEDKLVGNDVWHSKPNWKFKWLPQTNHKYQHKRNAIFLNVKS